MKFRKFNSGDKTFIIGFIYCIFLICHAIYIKNYRQVIFIICCTILPTFLYFKLRPKYKSNSKEFTTLLKSIPIKSKFKHFLKQVPGFRSGEKINIIIASIYYIICLLVLVIGLIFSDFDAIKIGASSLFLPYILLTIPGKL